MTAAPRPIAGADIAPLPFLSSAGSSARSLAARTADVVNVLDFGAIGDGVTDNISAFNAAHASAAARSGGCEIIIPQGQFAIGQVWSVGAANKIIRITMQAGSSLLPRASVSSLVRITQGLTSIVGAGSFNNASSFATTAIEIAKPVNALPVLIEGHYISGFTNGILSSAGDSQMILRNFLNNTNNVVITDNGVAANICNNYMIGGNGIKFSFDGTTTHAEGIVITGNNILVSTGTYAFAAFALLEGYIAGNVLDVSYASGAANAINFDALPLGAAAYSAVTTYAIGNQVSSVGLTFQSKVNGNLNNTPASSPSSWTTLTGVADLHITGNWISGGTVSGAAVRSNGNNTDLNFTNNTIVGTANTVGFDLTSVNGGQFTSNRFLATIGGYTFKFTGVVNCKVDKNRGVNNGTGPLEDSTCQNTWLLNDSTPSGSALSLYAQVIGPTKTGYVAMTGAADKGSTFATSTVTLAQLAGRVMQLQADLTAQGIIGT